MKFHFKTLKQIRQNSIEMIAELSLSELNHIPASHSNNIIWNLGHNLVVQQLLHYRLSNLDCRISDELISLFKKGSRPQKDFNQKEIDGIKKYMEASVVWLEEDYNEKKFETYHTFMTGLNVELTTIEEAITFNNLHEGVHYGYALALKKLI